MVGYSNRKHKPTQRHRGLSLSTQPKILGPMILMLVARIVDLGVGQWRIVTWRSYR